MTTVSCSSPDTQPFMLKTQVSYEQEAIVKHVVTKQWGWEYIAHVETDQKPKTSNDSQDLRSKVLNQRTERERKNLRAVCVRKKSEEEELYSAQVLLCQSIQFKMLS